MMPSWANWCCNSIRLVVCMYFALSVSASNTSCPTWFYYSNTSQQCECGMSIFVKCNQQERKAEILEHHCVTAAEQEGQYYVAVCPFAHTINSTNRLFSELPTDPDQLNDVMCGSYNRRGLLCGQCIEGFGPAVNQFDLKCANCSMFSTPVAVGLYLLVELVPSTLFFVCVVIFRINITAGPLLGYVLFCQVFALFFQIYVYMYVYIESHVLVPLRMLFQISLTLSAFWNLNFFKPLIPAFCISETLRGIHTLMLSFVAIIYPIILITTTFVLIELHARNYRLVHFLWKPFSIILNKTNIRAVNSDAVIHAFATFVLLSSTTNLNNITVLTTMTTVVMSIGGNVYKKYLYIDPTVMYLSQEHVLYVLITLVISVFLVLIPSFLLFVYPTKMYTLLLRCVSARVRLAIMTFGEALHCSFKDGLNGTRDYRASAGLVILSALASMSVSLVFSIATGYKRDIASSLTFFAVSLLLSYIRPCKSALANVSLSYHCTVLGILSLVKVLWDADLSTGTEKLELTIIILPLISHILVFIWVGYTISHYVWSQFGHPSLCNNRVNTVVSHCFHRRRDGYQVLPDMTNS